MARYRLAEYAVIKRKKPPKGALLMAETEGLIRPLASPFGPLVALAVCVGANAPSVEPIFIYLGFEPLHTIK